MAAIPTDLLDRIRSLERQVRALMGSANTRPAMDRVSGGNVVISDGGQLAVRNRDEQKGAELLYIGQVSPARPDGEQQGFFVRRDDGSKALTVHAEAPDLQPSQSVKVFDRKGNALFADDTTGEGLARPYIPYPMPTPENTRRWESTDSTEWTTLYSGEAIAQHPNLYCLIAATAGGEVRLLVNDAQVGPAGPGPLEFTAPIGAAFDSRVTFQVQARATAAGGAVSCRPRALYGVQS
ncbi:hypothetical protein [Streptomyces syringium]|uniref:Uncharacterized protein n=1 Tax=Streptomyces syringium TaxID=76729 RepID=A0ABS4Y484_9ACTN|nr:hypothetical protein [Streptomyces syringium]MBP2403574.1 hypothetical protein [Streptomyces syringium]SPE55958.1 hypothetical protein SNS2_2696 [Streptomyces netropsis]